MVKKREAKEGRKIPDLLSFLGDFPKDLGK
jgi:hypothetical protein